LYCQTSDWRYTADPDISTINFLEENYKAFGHREFEPFMDGTQEYNQYLIPRLNQNLP